MKNKLTFILLVSLIGVGLSSLSLYQFVALHMGADHAASFCAISEHVNCAQVHLSSWSSLFGIPLASYGIGFYLLMIVVALLSLTNQIMPRQQSRDFIFLSALLASLSSILLLLISEILIGALCPVCLAMYVTNFILLYFAWRMPAEEGVFGRIGNAFRGGIALLAIWIPRKRSFAGFLVRMITLLLLCLTLGMVIAGELLFTSLYVKMQPEGAVTIEGQRQVVISGYVKEWQDGPAISLPIVRNQIVTGDFIKGKEGAPIKIIEFSDFQCPHCQQLGLALTALLKEYPDAIEVVHRDFPLDNSCNRFAGPLHMGACKAAEFARCAGEQGKFWSVAEMFFESGIPQGRNERAIVEKLMKEASSLGLDADPMRDCLASGRHLDKIKRDTELGDSLKVQGTPAVWINGKYLKTPHPDIVREIVEQLSGASGK